MLQKFSEVLHGDKREETGNVGPVRPSFLVRGKNVIARRKKITPYKFTLFNSHTSSLLLRFPSFYRGKITWAYGQYIAKSAFLLLYLRKLLTRWALIATRLKKLPLRHVHPTTISCIGIVLDQIHSLHLKNVQQLLA